MQKKLITTALGAFGFGALVGWAVTADIREKQLLNERKQYEEMIHYKTEHIWALQDRLNKIDGNPFGVVNSETNMLSSIGTVTAKGTVIPAKNSDQTVLFNEYEIRQWGSEDPIKTIKVPVGEDVIIDEDDEIPEGETPEETRTNLQKLIDQYVADPDTQDEFVDIADKAIEYGDTPPFVISQGSYAWDEEGEDYEKISLTYYPRDRVLLDDEEDPIEDIASYVGWRNLTQFGDISEDPNVVFVRNRRMKTDFEVIKEEELQLPLHVKYGMEKEEFRVNRAAGLIRLRQEDDDN